MQWKANCELMNTHARNSASQKYRTPGHTAMCVCAHTGAFQPGCEGRSWAQRMAHRTEQCHLSSAVWAHLQYTAVCFLIWTLWPKNGEIPRKYLADLCQAACGITWNMVINLIKGSGITFPLVSSSEIIYLFLNKQWNLVWVLRPVRLYRGLLATNLGRITYCISKWLQIPNIVQHRDFAAYQSTSMALTASDFIPILFQQCIFHYLYLNHDNCSAICCYLFTPCHKYFKCFHHCLGLLAPTDTHISVVFFWTSLI